MLYLIASGSLANSIAKRTVVDSGKLSVIYEDNHLLAVDKPIGMPSQPDDSGDPSLVDWGKDWLRAKYP